MRKKVVLLVALGGVFIALGLRQVFSGAIILPQTVALGPLEVHYYGIAMALAVAAGYWLAKKRAGAYGFEPRRVDDIVFWLLIGGFAGARLYHVFSSFSYYAQHPLDILKVWNGGLSIYGAVLGGLAALILYRKFQKLSTPSLPSLLDWLTPSLLAGQLIGRLGNLFNYEAFGYKTNLPWKMFVPEQFRPAGYEHFSFFHPLFLYEILWNGAVLAIILFFSKRMEPRREASPLWSAMAGKPGSLFFIYLLLYNMGRFFLEFIRIDSTFIGAIRLNSVVSALFAAISLILLISHWKHGKVP